MAYTPPSLYVEQELVSVPDANTLPLHACILAPRYGLHRYSVEEEQAFLGAYDPDNLNSFTTWPDRVAGSTIDLATSVLKIQDAILQYFNDTVVSDGGTDGLLEDGGNKVRIAAYVFKTANGSDRSGVLGSRDVALGDYVKVVWGGSNELETTVAGLVADIVDMTIGATGAAAGNAPDTNGADTGTVITPGTGTWTSVTVVADETGFKGEKYGHTEEVYTLTVTAAPTNKFDGGVTFSVAAQNGDDDGTLTIGAGDDATPVALGAYGALVTFDWDNVGDPEDIQVGDVVTVTIDTAYTDVSGDLEAAGDYVGTVDTTYVVEIVEGGVVGVDTPKIKAITINGTDAMATTDVTADAANFIGTKGVTLYFATNDQLVKGDKFTIVVTAAGAGPVSTLVLANALTGALDTDTLTVTLGLKDTIDVEDSYWTAAANLITIAAAAQHNGTYLGTSQNFNILGGDAYIDYRELLATGANVMNSLSDLSQVEDVLGPAVEENPISLMVKSALSGGNGTAVYYIQVATNDVSGYTTAAGIQDFRLEPYSLVPHSTDRAICDAIYDSVQEASSPEKALFRIMMRGVDVDKTSQFYTATDADDDLLATLVGTTLTGTNTEFITKGIRPGDTISINYQPDNKGGVTYDTYIVDSVTTEDELEVTEAPPSDLTIAVKMEVWRTFTGSEYADAVGAEATHYTDRRVNVIWSDKLTIGGQAGISKAYLAAYMAGLRAAVAPHQPLSNYPLSSVGLEDTLTLTGGQLDQMAAYGIWIVYEDEAGTALSRHQLTTDMQDVRHREQSVTTNADSIVRDMRDAVSDLYGRGNVSDGMLSLISSRILGVAGAISARRFAPQLGPQIQDINIQRLEIDPVNIDRVIAEVDLDLPEPLNRLQLKFRIF